MCSASFLARLLPLALVCLAAPPQGEVEDGCLEEAKEKRWGDGLLQSSYVVHSDDSGPRLTADLDANSFSDIAVPFPAALFVCFGVVLAVIFVHELSVSRGCSPIHSHSPLALQLVYLLFWANGFIGMSFLVPLSLDFAVSMGQGAVMSGVLLSGGAFAGIVGVVVGKQMTSETDWNQKQARRIMLCSSICATGISMTNAMLIQATVHSDTATKNKVWWYLLGSGQLTAFIGTLPFVPAMVMWGKVTPQEDKTFWMILTQCARNGGLVIGPALFAIMSVLLEKGRELSPETRMAWSYIILNLISICMLCMQSFVIPTEIDDKSAQQPAQATTQQASGAIKLEPAPEDLEPAEREKLVWNMIYYAFERPFTIAAVEVATIMMLEVIYGWSAVETGAAFSIISGAGIILSMFSTLLLSKGMVTESRMFYGATLLSLFGVLFLFDIFPLGAAGLLLADALIYGCASVANGIAEGWASRAAMPNTSFSNENYRVRNMIAVSTSRFASPIIARFLVDAGGRNVYALLQLVFVCLGSYTVYKTCNLVWTAKDKSVQEERKQIAEHLVKASQAAPEQKKDKDAESAHETAPDAEPSLQTAALQTASGVIEGAKQIE